MRRPSRLTGNGNTVQIVRELRSCRTIWTVASCSPARHRKVARTCTGWSHDVYALATPDEPTAPDLLSLFFSDSEESRAKGMESIGRLYQREVDRDEPTDLATRDAQLAAITAWGIPDESKLNRLAGITQPAFVANGDNDTMMHTQDSYLLAEHLPNAQRRIYPDAGHGFLNQYPELFADDVHAFRHVSRR